MDKVKVLYHEKLLGEESVVSSVKVCPIKNELFPHGWALGSIKKATQFSNAPRQYLGSEFKIGQETAEARSRRIACDLRYARNEKR